MVTGKVYLKGVKFKGVDEKSGVKDGKPWSVKEVNIFIPDFGPVKVRVFDKYGQPNFPKFDDVVDVELSPWAGKFREAGVCWDHTSKFVISQ